jgi:hypothetical protein
MNHNISRKSDVLSRLFLEGPGIQKPDSGRFCQFMPFKFTGHKPRASLWLENYQNTNTLDTPGSRHWINIMRHVRRHGTLKCRFKNIV